jgi:hypoxanthine phosphoribosyltransferase
MTDSALAQLASPAEVEAIVERMASAISADHPGGVLVVGVLRGSVCLLADLVRRLTVPVEIDFLAVAAYNPDHGRVRLLKDLEASITGRSVVLITDIVDTGLTARFLRAELQTRRPASVALATLVDRPARRIVPVELDYVGIEVPDVFVLGYGLDFAGRYRNLRGLWSADATALAAEPDLHLLDLYGP